MESCDVCGFEWDAISADEVATRLRAAVGGFREPLAAEHAAQRPNPTTWSSVEYGAHLRDVILNVRDRIILGAIEDNPTPPRLYPDDRVALGLYAGDSAAVVAAELEFAAELLLRNLACLDATQLARPIFYAYPQPQTRTLLWVAAQILHEAEHHLADVRS